VNFLLVGKTGVFDTLAVANGCLNHKDIGSCPSFADLGLENSKSLVKIGADPRGNELFVVGYKAPKIIQTINQEIGSLSNISNNESLQVIPLSIEGENVTWLLTKLANIPLIGLAFLKWARNRTLQRSSYLLEFGKNLHLEDNLAAKGKTDQVFAAKPQINES